MTSLWRRIHHHPEVRNLYGKAFPLEIRHYFDEWIEAQPWDDIALHGDSVKAATLKNHLLTMIQAHLSSLENNFEGDTFILRTQLSNAIQQLEQNNDALSIAKFLAHSLLVEKSYCDDKSPSSIDATLVASSSFVDGIRALVLQANWHIQEYQMNNEQLEQQQETFMIKYHAYLQLEKDLAEVEQVKPANQFEPLVSEKQKTQRQLMIEAQQLLQSREAYYDKVVNAIDSLKSSVDQIITQIQVWKDIQRRQSMKQDDMLSALNRIQACAEETMQALWMSRQLARHVWNLQIRLPISPDAERNYEDALKRTNDTIAVLLHNAFVVDCQPPQVLKTQTRFQACVRFLISHSLNIHLTPPEVTVILVNEQQACQISSISSSSSQPSSHQNQDAIGTFGHGHSASSTSSVSTSGDILNNTKAMSWNAQDGILNASFKALSLRKIKRGVKPDHSDHIVTEQKFALYFSFLLTLPGGDTVSQVKATFVMRQISMPVVVVVHGNQIPSAEATILWDNSFALPHRLGFEVADKVDWNDLSQELRRYWVAGGLSPLEDSHLVHFAKMLGITGGSDPVTWFKFSREYRQGQTFTFWEWFHGCFDTTRKHLQPLWNEGLIHGFLDKDETTSLIGAVSVSWVDNTQDGMKVYHLQPWSNRDISIRSLADRLSDLDQLQVLYPDKSKHATFSSHYSSEAKSQTLLTNGYVPANLKAFINMSDVDNDPTYQPRRDADCGFHVQGNDISRYQLQWHMGNNSNTAHIEFSTHNFPQFKLPVFETASTMDELAICNQGRQQQDQSQQGTHTSSQQHKQREPDSTQVYSNVSPNSTNKCTTVASPSKAASVEYRLSTI